MIGPDVRVRCPSCGAEFETADVGDVVVCEECGDPFNRFVNVVGEGRERV